MIFTISFSARNSTSAGSIAATFAGIRLPLSDYAVNTANFPALEDDAGYGVVVSNVTSTRRDASGEFKSSSSCDQWQ